MTRIPIQDYFNDTTASILLDVRTPLEFEKGYIPTAINFPLFTNEERVQVGTTYKKVNPQKALIQGLEFVGPKMAYFVEEALKISQGKKIYIYCWRGGKRSGSLGWLLSMAGMDVSILDGGYKAYRAYIKTQFAQMPLDLWVLSGQTGSAKTEILKAIEETGEQFVDLEGIAHHKGSAFGALGQLDQPTSEHFHNLLHHKLHSLDPNQKIWVEGESKGIGQVYLTEEFWARMSAATEIEINVPLENRVEHLLKTYGQFDTQVLKASFDKILKRLGGLNHKNALQYLEEDNLGEAATIALNYYDKAYKSSRIKRNVKKTIDIDENDVNIAAQKILSFVDNFKQG